MGAIATEQSARRRHQHQVAALLEEIERSRSRVETLRASGATWAGVRPLKHELRRARAELAAAVEPA